MEEIWRTTQGFSNIWDKLHSHPQPNTFVLFCTRRRGQAVVYSTLLLPYRNQGWESSSIKSHTPFHCSLKMLSTLSLHRVFRESSHYPALENRKGLLRRKCPLLCCGYKHIFMALESDVCLRWECVHVVKCVYLSMCARGCRVGVRVSAPLSWGYTLLSSSSGSLPSAPLPWGLWEWLCAPLLCFL